jgi:hypothetical protein
LSVIAGLGKALGAGDAERARAGEIRHLADQRYLDTVAGAEHVDRLRTHSGRCACRKQIFSNYVTCSSLILVGGTASRKRPINNARKASHLIVNGLRLADPKHHREAITSQPLLLTALGWRTHHAGQVRLTVSSTHGEQHLARCAYLRIAGFVARLRQNAEQLDALGRWYRILSEALRHYLHGRQLEPPFDSTQPKPQSPVVPSHVSQRSAPANCRI